MNYIEAAEEFIREGFNPLPLNENKSPKLEKGHNFLYEKIDNLDRFSDCARIGVACGAVSGGLKCIDFDAHKGQDIKTIWKEFMSDKIVKNLYNSNKIAVYKTMSGGYHLYLKTDKVRGGTAFARWSDKGVMIEMRGDGQYVCCAPSKGYKQIGDNFLTGIETMEEEDLEYMTGLATKFSQYHVSIDTRNRDVKSEWPSRWDDSTPVGKFNNEQGEFAKELLLKAGWAFEYTRSDGTEMWRRPGKDKGHSATFGNKFNMFYVFSQDASCEPFKPLKAYSPFQIFTLLKFNGDWKAAKRAITTDIPMEEDDVMDPNLFPVEVFPDPLQEYILELKRTLNFHPDFSAAAAMFTVATINGNCYKLRVKNGWEAPTIFWFACVGYPGTIKTHPVKTMLRPINTVDKKSKSQYDAQMVEFEVERERDKKTIPRKPVFHQCLISDYTVEALHHIHSINKRGLGLYKDELKGFLNDMNKYRKGSDEEFWLESFNNGHYIVNRVTKEPIMINNICINMIGTIQHDVLNRVVTEHAGNGLIDRFLFTAAEDKVYPITSDEIDPAYAAFWESKITAMNEVFKYDERDFRSTIVSMSPEAFELYQKIDAEYVQIQNSSEYNQDIKNYLSKMKTYIPRFALLLGIMETLFSGCEVEVGLPEMEGAKKIADYFVKTATNVFAHNDVQKEMKEIEKTFKGKKNTEKYVLFHDMGYSQKDISKFFNVSKQAVNRAINKK